MKTAFYLTCLQEELHLRQTNNPGYSLRAFARDLGINSSNLSAILKKKRGLPLSRVDHFCDALNLSPKQKLLFKSSVQQTKGDLSPALTPKTERQYLIEEKYFRIISEWEYYAFLSLIQLSDFSNNREWMCQRLGISKQRLKTVIEHLTDLGFIKLDKSDRFKRLVPELETTEDIKSQSLQKGHLEALQMAQKKLNSTAVEKRDYSSITLAIDTRAIPKYKALVREFYDRVEELSKRSKKKDQVYQLNCQLFPLTQKEK